ncbi:hypothetical protein [Aliikangiella coralliicola]|uniref:STAS/SEC14 domain-containing protein n=1 Tax=Aliikangiella coralliicola TaxID=2592383 RepID=A0A545U6H9_9GAMM|nr:hypothetical protein [Aliikangiella coralliicola]TQV85013.1 hypothetical protein FLL46_21730 [Aliikangiella coralliicola]
MLDVECTSYEVIMRHEGDRLRYLVTGDRDFRSSYLLWKRIYRDCEEYGVNKIHATVLLNGQIDKMEIPLLINKLIQLNDSRPVTCAWVDHNSTSYADNVMGEKIPRPTSMNVRIFNNDQDAIEWLDKN